MSDETPFKSHIDTAPKLDIVNIQSLRPPFKTIGHNTIELKVYPRLHLFSLDLSLLSGHLKSGSMGLPISTMPIVITVSKNKAQKDTIKSSLDTSGLDVELNLDTLRAILGKNDYWNVHINAPNDARSHTGLGISTQVAGGVFLSCAKVSGFNLNIDDLFRLGVGHLSGLGLKLLFCSNMIIENGYEKADSKNGLLIHPELSSEYELPSSTVVRIKNFPWYIIVGIPAQETSMSEGVERGFWSNIFPDKEESSYKIIYEVFQSIIPAVATQDFEKFIHAMELITSLGTKPAEESIQSNTTKRALELIKKGVGFSSVSSMGPTIYSFSEKDPANLLAKIKTEGYNLIAISPEKSAS